MEEEESEKEEKGKSIESSVRKKFQVSIALERNLYSERNWTIHFMKFECFSNNSKYPLSFF